MTDYKKKYLKYKIKYLKLKGGANFDEEIEQAIKLSLEEKKIPINTIYELPYLFDMNPYLINEEPDGNCLFRTFSRMVYGNPEDYDLIRINICMYLLDNYNLWESFIDSTVFPSYHNYIENMMKDTTWGGHIEIMAFRNLYGCTVVIHDPPNPPLTEEPNKINENILSITDINSNGKRLLENRILHIFRKNDHYQTLKFDNSDKIKHFT